MALRSPSSASGAAPVPPLGDHPEHIRLSAMRRAVTSARDDRQRRIDLLMIEAELLRPGNSGPRGSLLRNRAAVLRKAAPPAEAPPAAHDGIPAPITRALSLLRGEAMEELPDRDGRLKQLRAELHIFEAALQEVDRLLDAVREEQSRVMAEQLLPRHRAILRSKLEAALALAAATQAERGLIAELLMAGYEHMPGILTSPPLDPAQRLGTAAEFDSAISTYRRALESLKVI